MSAAAIVLLTLFMVISLLDVLTTERALRRGGREANPAMAWVMRNLGRRGAYAIKLLLAAGIGTVLALHFWPGLAAMCGFGCWVVQHNWRAVK